MGLQSCPKRSLNPRNWKTRTPASLLLTQLSQISQISILTLSSLLHLLTLSILLGLSFFFLASTSSFATGLVDLPSNNRAVFNSDIGKLGATKGFAGKDVVIVAAYRTAIYKAKRGGFKDTLADDLLAPVLKIWRMKLENWGKEEELQVWMPKIVDPKTGEERHVTIYVDDGIQPNANMTDLAKLKLAFKSDGTTTAGNASQVSDGA
ncbi:uncharacterized protein LOC133716346 [Rosa rugosa]|uniref:uncharacterized protein LOC133716346 n=1 Tax=Rosa rugosa TaxID=74645 RepID=UPI002B402858|nr:uncharacterized protein LOC133716346 [Rosa rugosa]